MMNIMHFYEAGKARSGSVLIPFFDTVTINTWRFSTRHGNVKVKWGDGNETDYVLSNNIDYTQGLLDNSMSHTYATPYTGDVEVIFKQGLKDVYSLNVVRWSQYTNNGLNAQQNKINIQDFGTYIKKFSNLYSYFIDTYSYNTPVAQPVIKGDLADIPESVERIKITSFEVFNNSTDVWFNFNSLPANSKLKFLDLSGDIGVGTNRKILGNLANLPVGCNFCRINKITSNSSITYTAGKVWASSFDTLDISLSLGDFLELDNIFIDLGNSITSAIGSKIINLGNGWITQKSAIQRSYLTSLGFTLSGVLDTSTGTASSTTKKFSGDISHIPSDITFFKIVQCASGSVITYTSGKVWASSFDTLSIPLSLSTSELDNLLIDMNNSITTKIGAGVITLGGFRSSISDAAVASLQAKGFTVNVKLKSLINDSSVIFRMDFQNNYDVYSSSLIDITSGNGVGSLGNLPTFALSGRKAGEYCAVFNGSQSIKTTTNLPINSDKVTIAFWMKTSQTTAGFISELSTSVDSNNAFLVNINNSGQANKIQAWSKNQGYNNITNPTIINDGVWRHFVAVIDRSQNATNEIKFYENGVLMTVTKQFSTDNSGNFVNNILFIGQRAGSASGFNGSLTKLKLYNYPFTPSEVANLYNSEL